MLRSRKRDSTVDNNATISTIPRASHATKGSQSPQGHRKSNFHTDLNSVMEGEDTQPTTVSSAGVVLHAQQQALPCSVPSRNDSIPERDNSAKKASKVFFSPYDPHMLQQQRISRPALESTFSDQADGYVAGSTSNGRMGQVGGNCVCCSFFLSALFGKWHGCAPKLAETWL
jgi:hypothetical protein